MVLAAAAGRGLLSSLRADPRQAVQEDSIRCLVCGGSFRQLTNTHLRVHRLNADEYKQRFGYNRGRPLMCAELCRLYTDRAVKNGLASRIRERKARGVRDIAPGYSTRANMTSRMMPRIAAAVMRGR